MSEKNTNERVDIPKNVSFFCFLALTLHSTTIAKVEYNFFETMNMRQQIYEI